MRQLAGSLVVGLIAVGFVALGLTAAWSLLHYRPYPLDGESIARAMKAMQDVAELRATADNLAWRKDLVSADFNQVFPAACVALIVASAFGAAAFAWILLRMNRRKDDAAPRDRAL
jgi:hypothetical protein